MEFNYTVKPVTNELYSEQGKEFFEIRTPTKSFRISSWDYDQMYEYPGLYEEIYCNYLKCTSHRTIWMFFKDVYSSSSKELRFPKLKIMDIGAGSGLIAKEVRKTNPNSLIFGIDRLRNAKLRASDSENLYDNYFVLNEFSDLPVKLDAALQNSNVYIFGSCLGGNSDDIGIKSFREYLDYLKPDSWIVLNTRKETVGDQDKITKEFHEKFYKIAEKVFVHRCHLNGNEIINRILIGVRKFSSC